MSEEKYKYQIRATTKFKKSAKLAAKRGKDTQKLKDIVEKLAKGVPLASYASRCMLGESLEQIGFTEEVHVPREP